MSEQKEMIALATKGKCPFCGSNQTDYDSVEINEGTAMQHGECMDCDKQWQENYNMVSVEEIE